ncbi:hypothetical protein [Pseudoxanthomonas sp. 10H]|uniref:hypothetical protein n=1 Tax=Pseudoxanthomonas sp. 10H TaxID=3242729 RepID=UPI003557A945
MTNFTLPLFFALFCLAIVWLVLVQMLFRALADKHPEMHQRIGSPRGFGAQATSALLSFLLTRKPESLGDRAVLLQANVMRVLLVVYVASFAILVYGIMSAQNAA